MKIFNFAMLSLLVSTSAFATPDLTTIAEKSGWKRTGRADEVNRLCHDFQKVYPTWVQCKSLGKTPEGRTFWTMTVGNTKDSHAPVIWVQAGIHAGEIDGKDATFWLLKDILSGKIKPNPLEGIRLVFIPIMNLDGHERFSAYNRPNQVGPEEMGWRVTAQNYNLNRDYLKVDTPEMRMITTYWRKMNPVLSLDLHVTDGADFQPEVGLIVLPNTTYGNSNFHQAGSKFEEAVLKKVKDRGHMALPFYPSFENEDDPMSGFSRYVALPRFSQGYWSNMDRIGMLVETHSWKDYATRVKTHYDVVLSSLELVQEMGKNWQSFDKYSVAGSRVPLEFKHTEKHTTMDFPGYEYRKVKSLISDSEVIEYNPKKKQIWKLPYYEELVPILEVQAPEKGYFIPAVDAGMVIPILKTHGIKFSKWDGKPVRGLKAFRASKLEFSPKPFEGHQTLKVAGEWKDVELELKDGAIFVPIDQRSPKIILQLFEPQAQDSLVSWGFFNRYFEPKEYMENYVAHQVGLEMLKDPKIREEFEARLKDDEFRKNPVARFEFFARKHASWDVRFSLYPVYKL